MRVLVTGATGFIGQFSVRALLDEGHEVRALVRDRSKAAGIVDGRAELVAGDAMDRAQVRAALEGRDALVQAAGVYSYRRGDAARVGRETPALARAILGAAADARIPHVVDISSIVVYTTAVARIDESTRLAAPGDPTWPDPYVRAKVAAELVGRETSAAGLSRVAIHPTVVIGPEDSGPGQSGSIAVGLLRGGPTTNGRLGFVDVRDVAAAVTAALLAPAGSSLNLCATGLTYRDLAARLDRLTGRHPRRTWLAPSVLRFVARLNDRLGGRMGELPRASAIEYVLTSPLDIDGSRATLELGITYHDVDETLADAIRWWAANGVIARKLAGRLAS